MVWHRFVIFYFHRRLEDRRNDKAASCRLLQPCDSDLSADLCPQVSRSPFASDCVVWNGLCHTATCFTMGCGERAIIVTRRLLAKFFFTMAAYLCRLQLPPRPFTQKWALHSQRLWQGPREVSRGWRPPGPTVIYLASHPPAIQKVEMGLRWITTNLPVAFSVAGSEFFFK